MSITLQDVSIKPESQFEYPEYIEIDNISEARKINVIGETILYEGERLWQACEETFLELTIDMLYGCIIVPPEVMMNNSANINLTLTYLP